MLSKRKTKKLLDYLEERDWSHTEQGEGYIEFSFYSPAGEDFNFSIKKDNLKTNLINYLSAFEWDEHVEFWVVASREGARGVPTLEYLLKDAKWIEEEFNKILEWIEEL